MRHKKTILFSIIVISTLCFISCGKDTKDSLSSSQNTETQTSHDTSDTNITNTTKVSDDDSQGKKSSSRLLRPSKILPQPRKPGLPRFCISAPRKQAKFSWLPEPSLKSATRVKSQRKQSFRLSLALAVQKEMNLMPQAWQRRLWTNKNCRKMKNLL